MLRITTIDADQRVTLKLEGKLSGAWVEEFERCWQTSANIYRRKTLVVDLSEVTFADLDGKRLLSSISTQGGVLAGTGLVPKSIIDEIAKFQAKPDKATEKLMKQGILKVVLVLLFASFGVIGVRGQEQAPLRLTLHDAVAMALQENPQVQIATLNFVESHKDQDIARSALLPQVGLEVFDRAERLNIYAQFGSPFPGIPEHVGPFQFFQAGPNFSMPLFDLTLWRRYRAAHQGVIASQAQDSGVREQIVLLVVSQYLAGLRANAAVSAARSRVDLAQALFNQADDLQKHGVGTGIDTLRANVELQNEKQRFLEAETQQQVALYGLARLLNVDPHREVDLADTPSFYETPEIQANQSIEQAYVARPEIHALTARRRIAELSKRAASESRLPKLTVSGGWAEQGLSAPSSIPTYVYQATVDMPLFTGGRIHAEMAKADIELKKVDREEADLRNQIALEVKTAVAQFESARNQVDVANLGVNLAKQEVSQARDRFQAGVANNIEVISAQDALARANDNQIVALYRYNQSRADIAHAVGQIEQLYSK